MAQLAPCLPPAEVSRPNSLRETIALEDDCENSEMSLHDLRETLTALEPAMTIPLNEILIVRIENGNDFFLTVSASFGPTHAGDPSLPALPHLLPLPPADSSDLATMRQQDSNLSRLRFNTSSSTQHLSAEDSEEVTLPPLPSLTCARRRES
jgi:hypothetical protein